MKMLKLIPLGISIIYLLSFLGLTLIVNYYPSNKEFPYLIYYLYDSLFLYYIIFPIALFIILIFLYTYREKIYLYYVVLIILLVSVILVNYFSYLWNPHV